MCAGPAAAAEPSNVTPSAEALQAVPKLLLKSQAMSGQPHTAAWAPHARQARRNTHCRSAQPVLASGCWPFQPVAPQPRGSHTRRLMQGLVNWLVRQGRVPQLSRVPATSAAGPRALLQQVLQARARVPAGGLNADLQTGMRANGRCSCLKLCQRPHNWTSTLPALSWLHGVQQYLNVLGRSTLSLLRHSAG